MPTYDWKCRTCGKDHSVDRKITESDIPPEACDTEDCQSNEFERIIIGGGNFILQGQGWFKKGGY